MVKITSIDEKCRLAKRGVKVGDFLVSVNGNEIRDVLDYRFYMTETHVKLNFLRDGMSFSINIRKKEYDDVGLGFETPLMDKKHCCKNKCIFCFVDQMPKGLRESLYFKDDDERLSFLHGNYITMTNLTDEDVDRIIKMRISPINVSVHTTNPELRIKMMKNKNAGRIMEFLRKLAAAKIGICAQLVICPGINDGDELIKSMTDLLSLGSPLLSCAVVPVGITKYREGLYPLRPFTKEEAIKTIRDVEMFTWHAGYKLRRRTFAVADELYIKAELPVPEEAFYEGYPQLANGVGLIRSVREDLTYYLENEYVPKDEPVSRTVLSVTGEAAYDSIRELVRRMRDADAGLSCDVLAVKNEFFGDTVTVAGLLTAGDIINAVRKKVEERGEKYDRIVIPGAALKADEDVFLDGITLEEMEKALETPVFASYDAPESIARAFGL